MLKKFLALSCVALTFAACGKDDDKKDENNNTQTNTAVLITVSGTLAIHSVSAALDPALPSGAPATDLTFGTEGDIVIQIVDPVAVIANPANYAKLAQGAVDFDDCNGTNCTFSFDDVDISGLTLGLVALVIDTRTEAQFVPTNNGLFGSTTASELKASGDDFATAKLFAISEESVHALAAFSGKDGDTLLADGVLFGLAVGANFAPVADVTITSESSSLTIAYPNATFTGVGTTTSATGFFLGVGTPAAGASTVVTGLTASGGGKDWPEVPSVGTNKGTAFAFFYIAND